MLEEVCKKTVYHVCIYPEYFLEENIEYQTNGICRDFLNVKELEFEKHRLEYYPQLPSRKTCYFTCTKEAIGYWLRTLTVKNGQILEFKIFEIQIDGKVFWTDSIYLLDNDKKSYWEGNSSDECQTIEGLFEGSFVVLKDITENYKKM